MLASLISNSPSLFLPLFLSFFLGSEKSTNHEESFAMSGPSRLLPHLQSTNLKSDPVHFPVILRAQHRAT